MNPHLWPVPEMMGNTGSEGEVQSFVPLALKFQAALWDKVPLHAQPLLFHRRQLCMTIFHFMWRGWVCIPWADSSSAAPVRVQNSESVGFQGDVFGSLTLLSPPLQVMNLTMGLGVPVSLCRFLPPLPAR